MTELTEQQRAAQIALWEMGDLSWKLRPEQAALKERIEQADTSLFVANISRRWGKSFLLVTYSIEQCLKNPKERIRYAAAYLTDLEEFILPAFSIILEDCPPDLRPSYVKSKKTWVFPNGAEIKLLGIDMNPDAIRGNAISKIVIDEAGFVDNLKYLYTSIIIPATMKQKNVKLIFSSTPPESPEHFFIELANRAMVRNSYACQTIDDISDLHPDERQRILDDVGGETSTEARREFFCEVIISADRALAPDFNAARHVGAPDTPHYGVWMMAGDTADVRDKNYFLLMVHDYLGGKTLVLDERVFDRKTPISVMVPEVLGMEGGRKCTRIVDTAYRTELAHQGMSTGAPRKDSFEAGLTMLRNAFHKDQVVIHERCKFLIQTLKGGMLNKNRTDYERTESLGHCEAAAALIYGLRHVDKTTNPYPRQSNHDNFVPPSKEQAHLVNTLKQAFGR